MKKRLLIFAQYCEAEYTIKKLQATPDLNSHLNIHSEGSIPSLYSYAGGYIALSNIGIGSAMMTVAKHVQLVDEIVNVGFAGALKDHHLLGSIQKITVVSKYIPLFKTLDPSSQLMSASIHPPVKLCEKSTAVTLISSDFPIHEVKLKKELSINYDLVDMEGYGVAFAANYFQKSCILYKIVSDFCSAEGRALIRENKKLLSEKISEVIEGAL